MTTRNLDSPYLTDGSADSQRVFLFAHGAGAPMDHAWMNRVARGMAEHGIRIVRFEFPYMAARRESGKKRGPDRQPVLLDTWRRVIDEHGGGAKVAIGGKSMGGRMASMLADDAGVRALVCLGYPFHPPGKPENLRTAHLERLHTPTLILQGTRDPFGTREDVATYALSEAIEVRWTERGGHSLEGGLPEAIEAAARFVLAH